MRFGASLSLCGVARMGSSLSGVEKCFQRIVSLSSQFRSTRFVYLYWRCFSSVAQVRPWVLFIIEGFFSRLGDSLSLFGSARCGASLAVLGHTPGFVSIASLGNAIGRVAFRLIFLPDRVLDGIAELLPRREISLGSNLLPMALRRWGQVYRFGISRLSDRRCPCSAHHDSPHLCL